VRLLDQQTALGTAVGAAGVEAGGAEQPDDGREDLGRHREVEEPVRALAGDLFGAVEVVFEPGVILGLGEIHFEHLRHGG
jgi:hypothetical protein